MSCAYTPILVGRTSPVSEILLPSKTANFPFPSMVIKKFNRPESTQKIHAVWIDVKCIHTNFGGQSLSSFGDTATFKNGQFSWTIVHGHQKIQSTRISSKNSCKYGLMSCAYTPILVGSASLVLEILLPSKTANFPFLTMDYSPWSSKNSIDRNRLKKFMQVWIDVTCMHANFGGLSLFCFGDIGAFKNGQFSLSDHGL